MDSLKETQAKFVLIWVLFRQEGIKQKVQVINNSQIINNKHYI